jgi:hypothetical protein
MQLVGFECSTDGKRLVNGMISNVLQGRGRKDGKKVGAD